jgi:hypothetical protein
MDRLLVFGMKEGLVECATVPAKREVILLYMHNKAAGLNIGTKVWVDHYSLQLTSH